MRPLQAAAPALEKAVANFGGKVALVKMNIDEHPQIAGQLGIQSIPAVIAFDKGQPVDGFVGALPESQIRGFIERLVGPIQSESAALLARPRSRPPPASRRRGGDLFRDFGRRARRSQGDRRSGQAPCRRRTARRGEGLVGDGACGPGRQGAGAGGCRAPAAALHLAEQASNVGELAPLEQAVAANPDDHQARFDLAIALSAKGERDAAADQLLEIIRRDRKWNDEAARKQLLQLFEAWGLMDPASVAARRKLSAVWF